MDLIFALFNLASRMPSFDVVSPHSGHDSWIILILARIFRVPLVIRYRHISSPIRPRRRNRWQYGFLAKHVITTGQCICDDLHENFRIPYDKMSVISTGVEAPNPLPDPESSRLELCQSLRIPPSSRFLLSIGILRSDKGHKDLMEAFDRLDDENIHLVILGSGPNLEKYKKFLARLGCRSRVHFPGYLDNVWGALMACELYVQPSVRNEGIPQSVLQALIAGKPILGTRVGGIPEVVGPNCGYLVDAKDMDAMESVIRLVLEGEQSFHDGCNHREENTLEVMGERTLEIYGRYLG